MKSLPKSVKILSKVYEIKQVSEDLFVNNTKAIGASNSSIQQILIVKTLTEQKKNEVLLHEILHSIFSEMDLNDSSSEEDVVSRLSVGLICVCQDNPKLMKEVLCLQQ